MWHISILLVNIYSILCSRVNHMFWITFLVLKARKAVQNIWGHSVFNCFKKSFWFLNQSSHFHIPFRRCSCRNARDKVEVDPQSLVGIEKSPESPSWPQEAGPRQQCHKYRPCRSSAQCTPFGVCAQIGSEKYVLISKVWFLFWFQNRKQFITPLFPSSLSNQD